MKKHIMIAVLINFLVANFVPYAVFAVQENSNAPKQFKSMAEKNKKVNSDCKHNYINFDWWENFGDDILNQYIERAVLNNYDLKMATIAVNEYYQNMKIQFAHELPQASMRFIPNYVKMPGSSESDWAFIAPGLVNYELDIFLKNRDKTKAVRKLYEVSKFDERAAYISVASAVGTTYINIVKLDKMIALQEDIVKSRQVIYELMVLRNQEGLTSTADTIRANKSYISGTADLLELKKQRDKLLNQLAVLIGENPENSNNLVRNDLDNIKFVNNIPKEISSEIIVQRPDYLKAEKMVEKAGIDVRVAKKELLPSLNLSGFALFNAGNLGSLITTKNMLWSLAGGASLPIFTGGAKIAHLKLKKNTYERILQNYYKTNLTAIQEINDALVTIKIDEEKMILTSKQAQLEKEYYKYSELKYDSGVISKLDLMMYKENLWMISKLTTQQKAECLIDYIALYKALGANMQMEN